MLSEDAKYDDGVVQVWKLDVVSSTSFEDSSAREMKNFDLVIFFASTGSRHREVCKVLQSDLPPQLLVLRQLRDVRAPQLHPALRPVPDDRQLPQQEVQMVGGTKA